MRRAERRAWHSARTLERQMEAFSRREHAAIQQLTADGFPCGPGAVHPARDGW